MILFAAQEAGIAGRTIEGTYKILWSD